MEIIISFISLGIAFFALGWNFYKDVIQKPRFKASFGVYIPVAIPIFNIDKPFAVVIPNTQWSKLPQKIAVGEEAQIVTDYFEECFLAYDFCKAGLIDSYGRYHWVSAESIVEAKKRHKEDFSDGATSS